MEILSKEKPPGWQTTDPLKHNPDNFRYIVHTTTKGAIDHTAWLRRGGHVKTLEEYRSRGWDETLAGFLSQNSISCTIINESHRGIYQADVVSSGFILDVPEENIVALAPTDLGTHNYVQDRQEREQRTFFQHGAERKRNTPSAQAFLESCRYDFRNEVLIDGIGPEGRQIRIVGLFLIVDPISGTPLLTINSKLSWSPRIIFDRLFQAGYFESERVLIKDAKQVYKEVKDLARILTVPIIHIPECS